MPLVRVPVAGTIGKAVRINPDATEGSQVGTNFQLPDGSVPSLTELAIVLQAAVPLDLIPGAGPWPGFVFETEVTDGVLLARVADDETITGAYTFQNAAGIVIQDAGGTDNAALSHDGTDFNYVYTNTGTVASSGAAFYKFDNNLTLQSATTLPVFSSIGGANNHSIAISPTGMVFNHDIGSQTFTISGAISDIAAGTVDVDFDAITATSYGGITEANLLDKSADEDIAGQWSFKRTRDGVGKYAISVESATPWQEFLATGASADEGRWSWGALATSFVFRSNKDDDATGTAWLIVNRTAEVVDNATFGVPILAVSYEGILATNLLSQLTVITAQTALASGLASTDELLVSDAGTTKRMDVSVIEAYMLANLGFLTSFTETNDLTAAVTWDNIPDANVPESAVTQHETALTILEAQITDGSLLARVGATEAVTGAWSFKNAAGIVIFDAGGTDSLAMSHDGVDFSHAYTNTADVNNTGATAYTFDDSIIIEGNFALEGYATGRNIIRTMVWNISPGATPGTNINTLDLSASRGFNPLAASNAANLAKSTSSGDWVLDASGSILSYDPTEVVVGIISVSIVLHDLNSSSTTEMYFVDANITGRIDFRISKRGTTANLDWTTVLDAGDIVRIVVSFVTSS